MKRPSRDRLLALLMLPAGLLAGFVLPWQIFVLLFAAVMFLELWLIWAKQQWALGGGLLIAGLIAGLITSAVLGDTEVYRPAIPPELIGAEIPPELAGICRWGPGMSSSGTKPARPPRGSEVPTEPVWAGLVDIPESGALRCVARTEAQWRALWTRFADGDTAGLPLVDFTRHAVLVASSAFAPIGPPDQIRIDRAVATDDGLAATVEQRLRTTCTVAGPLDFRVPAIAVRVPRVNGTVRFLERATWTDHC